MPPARLPDAAVSGLRKVCYHHLKKCGGTSLNAWLETQFPVAPLSIAALEQEALASVPPGLDPYLRVRAVRKAFAQVFLDKRDLYYNHLGIVGNVPEHCFCFTILREPRARLLSQVRDYRRLSEAHIAGTGLHAGRAIRDAQSMRLRPFLEKYAKPGQPHRDLFDNYIVRAIAMNRVGLLARELGDARKLLPVALDVVATDMDFVGILEKGRTNHDILAAMLDWMPEEAVPVLNKTEQTLLDPEEVEEAEDLIDEMTDQDRALYAAGLAHFSDVASSVTTTDFSSGPLQRRFSAVNANAGRTVYGLDLSGPLTATGHDGRHFVPDGRPCLYLSNPQRFRAFVQTPPDRPLEMVLHLGWRQSADVISGLQMQVDDSDVALSPDENARNLHCRLAPGKRAYREICISLPPYESNDGRGLQLFGISIAPVEDA